LLVALAFCAVQARRLDIVERPTRNRTATSRVASPPGDALPVDSLNVRLVGQFGNPNPGVQFGYLCFVVRDSFAYVPSADSGLCIVNVADPESCYVAGRLALWPGAEAVTIDGDYAYMGGNGRLYVIDISDPTSPTLTGQCVTNGYGLGVTKAGNYVYVCNWLAGMQIIDVSDPENPSVTSSCAGYGARTPVVVGNYCYVGCAANTDSGMLQTIDITNKAAPVEVDRDTMYLCECVQKLPGDYLLVENGIQTLTFDISDSDAPVIVETYGNTGYSQSVAISGDYAYVQYGRNGMDVLDVSDPLNLTQVGWYRPDSVDGEAGYCANGYFYMTDDYTGLYIFEFYGDAGVEEGRRPPAYSSQSTTTIVRGVLFLTGDGRPETGGRATLLDAAGRRVMELQPGPNDVQHLSPGVYFVSRPKSVEKVLLTR
jgi:hypothetical protein